MLTQDHVREPSFSEKMATVSMWKVAIVMWPDLAWLFAFWNGDATVARAGRDCLRDHREDLQFNFCLYSRIAPSSSIQAAMTTAKRFLNLKTSVLFILF
jgi:hypothetical protein